MLLLKRVAVEYLYTVGENSLSLSINWNQLQLGLLRSVDPNKQRHVAHVLPKPMYSEHLCLCSCRVGGTTGAVITSPLDVVKTRLQSSCVNWNFNPMPPPTKCQRNGLPIGCLGDKLTYRFQAANVISSYSTASPATQTARLGLWKCLKYVQP